MRNIATVLVIAGIGALSMTAARAADQLDQRTAPQNHVQQHQDAVPDQPSDQQSGQRDSGTPRDQSAQAPQSPAVIAPPETRDRSVITPPETGTAKTPVIRPPGTPGANGDVQPK
jgi:hypothetical protein